MAGVGVGCDTLGERTAYGRPPETKGCPVSVSFHGMPCWYELTTSDLAAAEQFYGAVVGWSVADSGMPGMTYHLASAADGVMVAGMSAGMPGEEGQTPCPKWLVYFACDDCDETAAAASAAGGGVDSPPMDIPGTGRFAICADPQGAAFGLLQPLPMEDEPASRAFDQEADGHAAWQELMTSDPVAGVEFYVGLLGWGRGESMPMGEMGDYQLVQRSGQDIGGVMTLGGTPEPAWMPYFAVPSVQRATAAISESGGSVHHGPAEVPGGAHIAIAHDPQGAWFGVFGPLGAS